MIIADYGTPERGVYLKGDIDLLVHEIVQRHGLKIHNTDDFLISIPEVDLSNSEVIQLRENKE